MWPYEAVIDWFIGMIGVSSTSFPSSPFRVRELSDVSSQVRYSSSSRLGIVLTFAPLGWTLITIITIITIIMDWRQPYLFELPLSRLTPFIHFGGEL